MIHLYIFRKRQQAITGFSNPFAEQVDSTRAKKTAPVIYFLFIKLSRTIQMLACSVVVEIFIKCVSRLTQWIDVMSNSNVFKKIIKATFVALYSVTGVSDHFLITLQKMFD